MRPVSAGSSRSMAAKPRKSAARHASNHDVPRCAASAPSSVVPAAIAVENTTIIKTGSTSGAIVISREAPMPPNAPLVERTHRREEAGQREQPEEHDRVAQRKGRRPRPHDRNEGARGH